MVVSQRFDNLGADGARVRLGIFGGTFDPIHVGHLANAQQAMEACDLDAVLFMPAGNPVFKQDRVITDARHRLRMCEIAIADNSAFDASPLEVEREGFTYTADTLRALRNHYPENVEFYFIVGADAAFTMLKWRDVETIARLAKVVVVMRPGTSVDEAYLARMREEGFAIQLVEMTALDVSATEIRERLEQGRSVRYLIPDQVFSYVLEHGLYGTGGKGIR